MQTIDEALEKLQASPFRAKFRLSERERAYIGEKGLDTIREHARGFIETRLAPAELPTTGGRPPCGDTRCSSPSTPVPAAAASACTSGIRSRRASS